MALPMGITLQCGIFGDHECVVHFFFIILENYILFVNCGWVVAPRDLVFDVRNSSCFVWYIGEWIFASLFDHVLQLVPVCPVAPEFF